MENCVFKSLVFFCIFTSGLLTSVVKCCPFCEGVEIVSHHDWLGEGRAKAQPLKIPVKYVFISHTGADECTDKESCEEEVRELRFHHMQKQGAKDIIYNFLIGGDGRVYEGAGMELAGAHMRRYNKESWGIAFMGNFRNAKPNQKMLRAAQNLLRCGVDQEFLSLDYQLYPESAGTCTLSPGEALRDIIKTWNNYKGGRATKYFCSPRVTKTGKKTNHVILQ